MPGTSAGGGRPERAARFETLQAEAKKWLAEANGPRWKRPYTELTYLPMQDVLKYLRASGYKTYIVTGGGQDFVSHHIMVKGGHAVTVPVHGKRDLKPGLIAGIARQ